MTRNLEGWQKFADFFSGLVIPTEGRNLLLVDSINAAGRQQVPRRFAPRNDKNHEEGGMTKPWGGRSDEDYATTTQRKTAQRQSALVRCVLHA
jgi:hypothetical protein